MTKPAKTTSAGTSAGHRGPRGRRRPLTALPIAKMVPDERHPQKVAGMTKLSPQDFIHPDDEAARRNLEAIPGFSALVKAFLKIGWEQYQHGVNLASKIRLSENQLPSIYAKLPPLCAKLGIAVPDFYLEMDPAPNAYTFGDTRIFITVTSGLLEYLDDDEVDAVLAHECGHIACHHVLYHTMASLLKDGADALGALGSLAQPAQLALLYWNRRSELSADRAAAVALGSPSPVIETMIRLAGGPERLTGDVNLAEYVAQADEYDRLKSTGWDGFLQRFATATLDHPFTSVRTREILAWCETEPFERLRRNLELGSSGANCPRCGKPFHPSWKFCKGCGNRL